MKTKNIHQTIVIATQPAKVYRALIDTRQHARFTGDSAAISKKVGGAFRCHGHYITGYNLELKPGQKIVQAWRSMDWPKGHYSIVTFQFTKAGKGKTKLEFTQVGVPAGDFKAKSEGWKFHYWQPLKAVLEG